MIDEAKLSKWLISTVVKPKGNDFCMVISCRHYNKESGTYSQPIEEWVIRTPESSQLLLDIEKLKEEITNCIQQDASALEGHQQYVLIPFFGEGKSNAKGRLILKVFGVDEDSDSDGSLVPFNTEAATSKGRNAQDMRHHETMFQMNIRGVHGTMDRLQQENDKLRAQNDVLQARVYKTLDIVETLTSQAAKRVLEQQEAQLRMQMTQELFDKAKSLLPIVVNYLGGANILQETSHPIVTALEDWITSFDDEQWAQMEPMLLGQLDPIKRMPIQKMIEGAFEKKKMLAAKEKAGMLGSSIPLDTTKQLKS